MKNLFLTLFAVSLSVCILLLFGGCAENESAESSVSAAEYDAVSVSREDESFSEKRETDTAVTEKSVRTAGNAQVNESKAYLVDLYNRGCEKGNLKRVSLSQKTLSGTIDLGIEKIDLNDEKNAELRENTQTSHNGKSPCPAGKLSCENVENAERKGNKITFTLKPFSAGIEIPQGAGNYMGIVERERTQEILISAAEYLKLPGKVKVKAGEYTLSDGVITAYFSEDFKTVEKITFSGREKVKGKVEYLIMNVGIDIEFSLSSVYEM